MNRILLVGRLTKDPEVKYLGSVACCSFIIAVDREKKEQTENEKADFINCVCWNELATALEQYCSRGNLISIDGKLRKKSYYDNSDNLQYITEVYCESIRYLEKKR